MQSFPDGTFAASFRLIKTLKVPPCRAIYTILRCEPCYPGVRTMLPVGFKLHFRAQPLPLPCEGSAQGDCPPLIPLSKDTTAVEIRHLRCNVLSNPPLIYAGVFDIVYKERTYIVHFLYDIRTYLNKSKHKFQSTQGCYLLE